MLIFATTSKASVLGNLEVLSAFPKKYAIPAVSNLQELDNALQTSQYLSPADARTVAQIVQRQTGSDRVGIGIKTVLDCVFEARFGRQEGPEVVEALADLLVEQIQDLDF